jgi:hypothetical protein
MQVYIICKNWMFKQNARQKQIQEYGMSWYNSHLHTSRVSTALLELICIHREWEQRCWNSFVSNLLAHRVWKTFSHRGIRNFISLSADNSTIPPKQLASTQMKWTVTFCFQLIFHVEEKQSQNFNRSLRNSLSLTKLKKTKLRVLSPHANYTDRATAACRRS